MNSTKLKKLLILNVPYFLIGAFATNLGEAWRIAVGSNASEKVRSLVLDGCFGTAFSTPMPSIQPFDLLVGIAVGAGLTSILRQLQALGAVNGSLISRH